MIQRKGFERHRVKKADVRHSTKQDQQVGRWFSADKHPMCKLGDMSDIVSISQKNYFSLPIDLPRFLRTRRFRRKWKPQKLQKFWQSNVN